jgi:transcriptional regulator with XRE-family HTH domain
LPRWKLAELRDTLKVTQVDLAERMKVSQAAISKLEKPNRNIHFDQLRSIVSATGGNLIIIADFADILQSGGVLCYTSQNLGEFSECLHSSARPHGYDLSPQETDRRAKLLEEKLRLLSDSLAAHEEWRKLLVAHGHGVSGVQVHDARLDAAMRVHDVKRILRTFNDRDFVRYPDIQAVHPRTVPTP